MVIGRYVNGEINTNICLVEGGVTVEIGDLMFRDDTDNLRYDGSSTANYYAYPLSYLRLAGVSIEVNKMAVKDRFLGVAMDDKDGIENSQDINISIATSGIFEFDLKPPKTVNVGDMVGASGTSSASSLYNQTVMKTTNDNNAIGYFAERKVHALRAEIVLRTAFSSKNKI